MRAYIARELQHTEPRRHPWSVGKKNASFRYYDFKQQPELIATVLEDFLPHAHHQGTQRFFDFLRWVNGPDSIMESNDCATRPPKDNNDPTSPSARAQVGRVMLLFREIRRNLDDAEYERLIGLLLQEIQCIDPQMTQHQGVFGLTLEPTAYELPHDQESLYMGAQLAVNYWVWGENDEALFQNLGRMFGNLTTALRSTGIRLGSWAAPG